jgi:DNA-binding MarR family transcriptional regulator
MSVNLQVAVQLAQRYRGLSGDVGFLADAFLQIWGQGCEGPRPLTARQYKILSFISDFIGIHGYAPSFGEIAQSFQFRSLASVHEHLSNLERKGWIRREYNEARALTILYEPRSKAA